MRMRFHKHVKETRRVIQNVHLFSTAYVQYLIFITVCAVPWHLVARHRDCKISWWKRKKHLRSFDSG